MSDSDNSTSTSENTGSAPEPSSSSESNKSERDILPIITYPEFLLQQPPQPSRPLLRPRDVLDTLLLAGGLSATLYSLHHWVLSPMTESLTQARESLAATALTNLSLLNSKLEASVSVIPDPQLSTKLPIKDASGGSVDPLLFPSETSSISDPTELFHVDVGTQTSPDLSRSQSRSQMNPGTQTKDETEEEKDGKVTMNVQTGRLRDLQVQLEDIIDLEDSAVDAETSLRSSVKDLTAYLETLTSSHYLLHGVRGNNSSLGGGGGVAGRATAQEDDPLVAAKKEIRGIKGSLLNAKNFPAASNAANSGVGAGGAATAASVAGKGLSS